MVDTDATEFYIYVSDYDWWYSWFEFNPVYVGEWHTYRFVWADSTETEEDFDLSQVWSVHFNTDGANTGTKFYVDNFKLFGGGELKANISQPDRLKAKVWLDGDQ
jgi:hypothetical protein